MSQKNEVEILRYSMFSGFQFFGRKWHFSRAHRYLTGLERYFVWRQKVKGPPFASFESKGFQWLRNAMGQQTLIYGYLVATVVQMFGLGESRESICWVECAG